MLQPEGVPVRPVVAGTPDAGPDPLLTDGPCGVPMAPAGDGVAG
ncbi:hypothetical protein ACQPZK_22760 [Micromonospora sp. CA-249363]|jgi:hypothetical protein